MTFTQNNLWKDFFCCVDDVCYRDECQPSYVTEDTKVDEDGVTVKVPCLMAKKKNFTVNVRPDYRSGRGILNISYEADEAEEKLATKSFKKSWLLPYALKEDTVPTAKYRGGVLTVVVPRPVDTASNIDVEVF